MNITKTMTLELTGSPEKTKIHYLSAKQGDNSSRYVKITLTNDGESYQVPKGVSANFRAQKPDGTMALNQAVVNDDGTVTLELTQQTLAVCGDVIADIYLTDGSGSVLSSASFVIQVEAAPMGDKIDSENEFLIFTALTEQAEHAAVQAKRSASDATTAAERATQAASQAADKLPLAGGTMQGPLNMGSQALTGLKDPVADTDAVSLEFAKEKLAPSGFGYGDAVMPNLVVNGDNDGSKFNAEAEKFLQSMQNGSVKQAIVQDYPFADGNIYVATIHKSEPGYAVIDAVSFNGFHIRKRKFNGTWLPWEYINPPMTLGVEYRTTERWQYKTVYTKLVNFGKIPINTRASVAHGAQSTRMLRCHGVSNTGDSLPLAYDNEKVYLYANNANIHIQTEGYVDTGRTAIVQLWYTKE